METLTGSAASSMGGRCDSTRRVAHATPPEWAESGGRQDWAEGRGHQQIIAYVKSVTAEADRAGDEASKADPS